MAAARWFLLASFAASVVLALHILRQVFGAGRQRDWTVPKGSGAAGVLYSLTAAMLPWKKESASLHVPVYILGVSYHFGTFLSFFWLVARFFGASLPSAVTEGSAIALGLTAVAGLVLLWRRILSPKLRHFSTPDDYFSNLVVTGFHALTMVTLLKGGVTGALFIYAGILLVYIPVGKLRHSIYFGLARYYLGLFYGRRGVWPAGVGRTWRSQRP